MSRWWSACIALSFVSYASSLAVVAGLAWAERAQSARGYVLPPLEIDEHERARTIDTHVADLHVRRICGQGRCDLMIGHRGRGYELLASYPSSSEVELGPGLTPRVQRIGPPLRSRRSLPALAWVAPALLLVLLLVSLRARSSDLATRHRWLSGARPAFVELDGTLRLTGGASPATAHCIGAVPPGPASALFAVAPDADGAGPYRAGASARYLVVPGAPVENIARLARTRGRMDALSWIAVGLGAMGAAALLV